MSTLPEECGSAVTSFEEFLALPSRSETEKRQFILAGLDTMDAIFEAGQHLMKSKNPLLNPETELRNIELGVQRRNRDGHLVSRDALMVRSKNFRHVDTPLRNLALRGDGHAL